MSLHLNDLEHVQALARDRNIRIRPEAQSHRMVKEGRHSTSEEGSRLAEWVRRLFGRTGMTQPNHSDAEQFIRWDS